MTIRLVEPRTGDIFPAIQWDGNNTQRVLEFMEDHSNDGLDYEPWESDKIRILHHEELRGYILGPGDWILFWKDQFFPYTKAIIDDHFKNGTLQKFVEAKETISHQQLNSGNSVPDSDLGYYGSR